MAKREDTSIAHISIKIKPELSWIDAVKLRIAGGKAAEKFWEALARQVSGKGAKK